MAFYLVLTLATLTIAALTVAVWRKTRQIAFVIGFAFFYYWSLYGGWLVVNRGMGSDRSYRFEYLLYRMFPVYLDEYYLSALLLYAGFIVALQITVLAVARRPLRRDDAPATRVYLSHATLLGIAAVMAAGAYALSWRAVMGAIASGTAAYGALSVPGMVRLVTIYQILHQSALSLTLIGAGVYVAGRDARYVVGGRGPMTLLGYGVVLGALTFLSLAMGNRSPMVFAAIGAGMLYLVNSYRTSRLLVGGVVAAAVAGFSLVGVLRGAGGMRELGAESLPGKVRYVVSETLTQDVEAFAAHASMYGTLQKQVPLTYGGSLLWLATGAIPAAVRPALVPSSYDHYAAHAGLTQGQGFNVHHATSWYLNFGVPGLFAGAVLLGWIWASLFNAFVGLAHSRSHFGRVFSTLGIWCFTAYLPILVRTGVEGYKGVALESLMIPVLLVLAASTRVGRLGSRLCLVPRLTFEAQEPGFAAADGRVPGVAS